MNKPKVAIILPTIREKNLLEFLELWKKELTIASKKYQIRVYVVEDNPKATFTFTSKNLRYDLKHYSWKDIDKTLGKSAWLIPHRSDTVRSFGVYLAYQEGNEYFITLDDDCYPAYDQKNAVGYFIEGHIQNMTSFTSREDIWSNSIQGYKPRGLPYGDTTVERTVKNAAISHGLWVNVPDFDAITALSTPKKDQYFDLIKEFAVPKGSFYPMCSMNLAWKREFTPLMYFLLMGEDPQGQKYLYDRFGDIWCGLFSKKILDHLNYSVVSGSPYIYHNRASSAYDNLIKEAHGIKLNEVLWKDLDAITLESSSVKELYKELSQKLPTYSAYWENLKLAMTTWVDLF